MVHAFAEFHIGRWALWGAGVLFLLSGASTLRFARGERTPQATASARIPPTLKTSPEQVVTELWNCATRGELLTSDGQSKIAVLFTKPLPADSKQIQVISNEWGPPETTSSADTTARVAVGYWPAGQVDESLKFTPPSKTEAMKFRVVYTTVLVQTYSFVEGLRPVPGGGFKRDTSLDRRIPAGKKWKIEGPEYPEFPFATVDATIRYVLEKRAQTKDPVVHKNAEETIAQLLKLH